MIEKCRTFRTSNHRKLTEYATALIKQNQTRRLISGGEVRTAVTQSEFISRSGTKCGVSLNFLLYNETKYNCVIRNRNIGRGNINASIFYICRYILMPYLLINLIFSLYIKK